MCVCVCVCYHSNESTKVHKPWRRHNACRQCKDIEGKMNCQSEWVVQRAPGEPADSKSMSGQLSPRSIRIERSVYKFFVHRTLSTYYQWQRFEGCPIE